MRSVGTPGYRALHESAGVSFAARSLKKLTGKSSWFKDKQKSDRQEKSESIPTVRTKQEQRKFERKERKGQLKKDNPNLNAVKTTGVMFIENTPFGELCARLQKCEDRKASVTGRRVKMVERGGSSLGQLFSNRNPWAGTAVEGLIATPVTRVGITRERRTASVETYFTRVHVVHVRTGK